MWCNIICNLIVFNVQLDYNFVWFPFWKTKMFLLLKSRKIWIQITLKTEAHAHVMETYTQIVSDIRTGSKITFLYLINIIWRTMWSNLQFSIEFYWMTSTHLNIISSFFCCYSLFLPYLFQSVAFENWILNDYNFQLRFGSHEFEWQMAKYLLLQQFLHFHFIPFDFIRRRLESKGQKILDLFFSIHFCILI